MECVELDNCLRKDMSYDIDTIMTYLQRMCSD